MEVQNGFISGIYNYCDRCCETCAFTSRCRVFADIAEIESSLDPNLQPVVSAPLLPQDVPPPPPPWLQEMIDELNEAAKKPIPEEELERLLPRVLPEHQSGIDRAEAYCHTVHAWLRARDYFDSANATDPRAVIGWFHTLIPAKVHRALTGLASDDPDERDWPADYDGSTKVALLGMERSHAAWLEMAERKLAAMGEIQPFVADLLWLDDALERVFPSARAFVRPGFDEPDAVAKLLAEESAP